MPNDNMTPEEQHQSTRYMGRHELRRLVELYDELGLPVHPETRLRLAELDDHWAQTLVELCDHWPAKLESLMPRGPRLAARVEPGPARLKSLLNRRYSR